MDRHGGGSFACRPMSFNAVSLRGHTFPRLPDAGMPPRRCLDPTGISVISSQVKNL